MSAQTYYTSCPACGATGNGQVSISYSDYGHPERDCNYAIAQNPGAVASCQESYCPAINEESGWHYSCLACITQHYTMPFDYNTYTLVCCCNYV